MERDALMVRLMTRTVQDIEVADVRTRGRPTLRYMDTIIRDVKKNGLSDVNIVDRNDWRMAVSKANSGVKRPSR